MDDSIQYHRPKKAVQNPLYANVSPKNESSLLPLATVAPYPKYTDGYTVVPDVRGMSIRKAKQILLSSNMRVSFKGSGTVVWQSPKPGTKKLPGSLCTMGLN
jgi:hypothetical protein